MSAAGRAADHGSGAAARAADPIAGAGAAGPGSAIGALPPPEALAGDRTPVEMRVAFGEALVELGRRDPRLVVLDGDLANATRVDAFANAFPERFIEAGIGEQNMIGMAAGLATTGLVPFATTFAAFAAFRDLDQVRVAVGQTGLHVVLVGAYAGLLVGRLGKSHLCLEDIAIMRTIPGMTVLVPADAVETRAAVMAAAAHDGPVYLRLLRGATPNLFRPGHPFRIGEAVLVREGSDVALITTGPQLARTLDAADMLAAVGIAALVVHVPTIKPLDEPAIVEAARITGAVVTAEDHSIVGGLGGAVAELLAERLPTPMRRVGTRDTWVGSGHDAALLETYGLTARHVADAAWQLVSALGRDPAPLPPIPPDAPEATR
jgi:transketolase